MANLQIDRGELSRLFKRMDGKTVQKMQVGGIRKGAQLIRKEMRRLAPPRRTGLLHKNLVYSVQKEKDGAGVVALIGPTYAAFYAAFIEFGTRKGFSVEKNSRGWGGREKKSVWKGGREVKARTHPGIKPKPFIRPAFDNNVDRVADSIIDGVWAQIEKEFLK